MKTFKDNKFGFGYLAIPTIIGLTIIIGGIVYYFFF